jgi:transglutaminase-like putative cysteine protease
MSADYQIQHETRYRHSGTVSVSQHVGYLTPRDCDRQVVHSTRVDVVPEPTDRTERIDYFGNIVTQLAIVKPYAELSVRAESRVTVLGRETPIVPEASPTWESVRDAGVWHAGRVSRRVAVRAAE